MQGHALAFQQGELHACQEGKQSMLCNRTYTCSVTPAKRTYSYICCSCKAYSLSCLLKRHPSYEAENGVAYSRLKTLIPQPCRGIG